ncbi:B12-binding domain-containing radical SAM protein [Saccharopolyspora rosea]|uniref:B12-binding domain-containing radical SAM protein n=1 Tax=Saccharopolyspora rosea TaxID=524884 RepID=A0ABW3FZS8_9PSEU|nr:radical SAM protein [Saccharopolyspora rosea]
MSTSVCIIRAPFQYRYSVLNVQEEPIITYLTGYFDSVGFHDYDIHDFHLERGTTLDDVLAKSYDHYVLAIRETGENTHYVRRIVRHLSGRDAKVWIYGQVARLRRFTDWPDNVALVEHSERRLAAELGLPDDGPDFESGLTARPYIQRLRLDDYQVRRARGTLETTRGCHFGCTFCFINQGKNYDKRWQVRPNEAILADLRAYCDMGIRNFVFYDSEFLGKDESLFPAKAELLERIAAELPKIRFKIYARADTLLAFDRFDLLKRAGLVQVFVGAESFAQADLDALNKTLRAEQIVSAVQHLEARDIYANLSFIVFNRNTSTQTIRTNLDAVEGLVRDKPRLLGIPSFTFSFESDWKGRRKVREGVSRTLSDKTYMIHDLRQKEQPISETVFDANLEPLMEIYRLLSYEWSKKLVKLNLHRDHATADERPALDRWFHGLTPFCLRVMREYLDRFESGELTLDTLPAAREELYQKIFRYYSDLPASHRHLETYEDHASAMDYSGQSARVEDDEYWLDAIPA